MYHTTPPFPLSCPIHSIHITVQHSFLSLTRFERSFATSSVIVLFMSMQAFTTLFRKCGGNVAYLWLRSWKWTTNSSFVTLPSALVSNSAKIASFSCFACASISSPCLSHAVEVDRGTFEVDQHIGSWSRHIRHWSRHSQHWSRHSQHWSRHSWHYTQW